MCGIAGVYNFRSHKKVAIEDLKRINELLSHRGPDDSGYYVNHEAGLGHRRLSIIDLNTGHQPIYNEDKSIVVVCNGEIYNFPALRESLIKKGHQFTTKSDTEVIVHLYEDYREDFVQHLRGMFSIALWDNKKKKLILVRDRLGIKPLFYALDNEKILFGSEIKSIVEYPHFEKRINLNGLHDYLSFMTTSWTNTMFDGVHRLLPAELLIVQSEKVEKRIYWNPIKEDRSKYQLNDFEQIFRDVVKEHLISDVPLGAFLSGGLDSSAVVAMMKECVNSPIKTFSIGFSGNKYYDETPYARMVANHLGTDHQEFIVSPDVIDAVPRMLEYFDEPFAVSSALPTFFLAELARKHVKVVLTGDGADEMMAGYHHRYLGIRNSLVFDRFPALKHVPFEQLIGMLMKEKKGKINKFKRGLQVSPRKRYFQYMSKFQEEEKGLLYSDKLKNQFSEFDSIREFLNYYDQFPGNDILNKWLFVDMKTSLPNEMLTKVDRMTMAFGLEARVPFLDHVLVEFLVNLPSSLKLKGMTPKYLLRKMMQSRLPKEILARKKHGFEVPLDDWIRGALKDYVKRYLNEELIETQGIFNWKHVNRFLQLHWEGRNNYGHQIWTLLMFQVWYVKHFKINQPYLVG